MNRIINSLGHRLLPFIKKVKVKKARANFTQLDYLPRFKSMELTYSENEILNSLIYKDETWGVIKSIGIRMWNDLYPWRLFQRKYPELIDNECANNKVRFVNRQIRCQSSGQKNDWIFLKSSLPLPENYMISFNATVNHALTEFQFAFQYNTISERYRFNLIENKKLNFEIVKGGFFHSIFSVPLSLELGTLYSFKIFVLDGGFSFMINDELVMSVKEKVQQVGRGPFVLILWDSNTSNIDVVYEKVTIYKVSMEVNSIISNK